MEVFAKSCKRSKKGGGFNIGIGKDDRGGPFYYVGDNVAMERRDRLDGRDSKQYLFGKGMTIDIEFEGEGNFVRDYTIIHAPPGTPLHPQYDVAMGVTSQPEQQPLPAPHEQPPPYQAPSISAWGAQQPPQTQIPIDTGIPSTTIDSSLTHDQRMDRQCLYKNTITSPIIVSLTISDVPGIKDLMWEIWNTADQIARWVPDE